MNINFRYLAAYFHQRFPLLNMALFAILFLTVYSVANFFHPAVPRPFGWREVGGILATISFFFRLRVFDEIKDFALDAVNHPHRVLQSGKVTLKQLSILAALGAAGELTWSMLMSKITVLSWLLAVGYSLLMRYEFFVPDFLKRRLVLYAVTHLLIMPWLMGWLWSAYAPARVDLTLVYLLLAGLGLLGGFAFEIARKIYPPATERTQIDSYSQALGYSGAITAVLLILLAGTLVQSYLLSVLQAGGWTYLLLATLYAGTLVVYRAARRRPHAKILKQAEVLVSLFMLISYLSIIVTVNF